MSLTLTPVRNGYDVWGKTAKTTYDVVLDTSYPLTNGYVIQASDVGLKAFLGAQVIGSNKAGGAVLAMLDIGTTPAGIPPTSAALRLFLPTGGATAPATLIAPALTAGAVVTIAAGATPVTSTAANGAIGTVAAPAAVGGIAKEVANTTDVSSLTYRIQFLGF